MKNRKKWVQCRETGELIEAEKYYSGRQTPKGPYVIEDTMAGTKHPCTGRVMDSKSEFRKVTKAHGCIEIGNEVPTDRREWKMPSPVEDIKYAMEKHGR